MSWRDDALRHLWPPFTQVATAPEPLPVVRARGAWLELEDGSKMLDCISSWWTINHGHGNPRICQAIAEQASALDHVLLAGCVHPTAATLSRRLADLSPGDLNRVFFSDDGSTSVEVALKISFQYWQNRSRPRKRQFIALRHGYHGDTIGAMSVGDPDELAPVFRPLLLPVARIDTADCLRCPVGLRRAECRIECLGALEHLLATQGEDIAALIIEPMVQGAGGMVITPKEFLRGVADLCRRFDVLLIADEVMTGFGRTGRMFAVEHAGVEPDLLCLAKGLTGGTLPLAATLTTDEIFDVFRADELHRAFLHGHSFTGNPIACAAALANLDIFAEEPVLERVLALEQEYARALVRFRDHPRVADVRWLGSIGVVELRGEGEGYFDAVGPLLRDQFRRHGYLVRPLGPVVYTLPPYCTSVDELRGVYDTLEGLLAAL